MSSSGYDLICVGGGLGGAALGMAMAKHGARVLVLEREAQFKDRVRGEGLASWGVAEARALGIDELMRDAGGRELRWWDTYGGPMPPRRRDLIATTTQQAPQVTFYHPEMQEALLRAAAAAGVEVRRKGSVTGVAPGSTPCVTVAHEGRTEEIPARLVVGADGRTSSTRKWAGFTVNRDEARLFIAGVLLEGMQVSPEAVSLVQGLGELSIFMPQANGRVRAYVAYHKDVCGERLQGEASLPRFIELSLRCGTPAAWYEGARAVGPLATFEGADVWVDHPYREGVALIGDAAASSDPSWGQGLSLTLRDVRVLRDALLGQEDWNAAGHAYAVEHDRYYGTLHTCEDWFTTLFMEVGPEADARRGRVLPRLAMDPTLLPPVLFSGPEGTLDEAARQRVFGA
jgi:2-polyprenyl-6-methoxyphenol hydroxylase-like FAD-dependent oxidoreductase